MSFWRNGVGKVRSTESKRSKLGKRSRVLKFACEPMERRRLFATVSWVTNGDGDWSNGANWSTGNVPATGDDVQIDIPGRNITVTYAAGGTLHLNNILNNERLIIGGGGATWTGGTWDGAGIITMNSPLALSGTADKILKDGETLVNSSTTTLTGTGNLVGQIGATIENHGLFDVQSDADITFPSGVGAGNFENFPGAVFRKSQGGTNPGDMTELGGAQGFAFNNDGDCQILQGTLGLGDNQDTSTSVGGTFEISAGAVLDYLRGVNNIIYFVPPPTAPDVIPAITGNGILRVDGGTTQLFGNFAVHQIDMNAGTFLLQANMTATAGTAQRINDFASANRADSARTDIFNLRGGVFGGNGAGTFTVNNVTGDLATLVVGSAPPIVAGSTSFNWTGGTLSGGGRLVIDPAVTTALISTTAAKTIAGGFALDVIGQVIWRDSGTLSLTGGSTIWVHRAATFWDQNDGAITGAGDTGNILNSGNFLKQGGVGTTTIDVGINFINDQFGTVAGLRPVLYPTGVSPLSARWMFGQAQSHFWVTAPIQMSFQSILAPR